MGISISHSNLTRSATSIGNLGRHLADVLSARDWRQISRLFDGRFADIQQIPPAQAKQIAAILRTGSNHQRMPDDWSELARLIAEAADRAARAGQSWTWS